MRIVGQGVDFRDKDRNAQVQCAITNFLRKQFAPRRKSYEGYCILTYVTETYGTFVNITRPDGQRLVFGVIEADERQMVGFQSIIHTLTGNEDMDDWTFSV